MPISSLKLAGQCYWPIYLIQPGTAKPNTAWTGSASPPADCVSMLLVTQAADVSFPVACYSTLQACHNIVVLLRNRAKPVSVCPQMSNKNVIAINWLAQHVWPAPMLKVLLGFEYFCSASIKASVVHSYIPVLAASSLFSDNVLRSAFAVTKQTFNAVSHFTSSPLQGFYCETTEVKLSLLLGLPNN